MNGLSTEKPNPSLRITASELEDLLQALWTHVAGPPPFCPSCVLCHQVPSLSELLSPLLPSCLCFCPRFPYQGRVILLSPPDLSVYSWRMISPCGLTPRTVEKHVHFYLRKSHCRRGTGMTSRKTVTHPSLPEMKDMLLGADCCPLL